MRDRSDRYQMQSVSAFSQPMKKLGGYLVEAGLLTTDQINVVLNDQQATGMRFGEIVAARGWVKEQTIEWIISRVVEPDRQALQRQAQEVKSWNATAAVRDTAPGAPVPPPVVSVPRPMQTSPGQKPIGQTPVGPVLAGQTPIGQTPVGKAPVGQTPSGQTPAAKVATPAAKASAKSYVRREVPISKPLPSVGSSDGDVHWVG